ncbi:peptide-binding protein [Nissabacter sp. SGAir0207]|uniref:peptide-binding protein n=1 Tax=Nissabacter sp. SGAir0207 TaxID=2126321 RepID=UPI0010CCD50E|nr:peptide-binding protein [Nissabacter sp. SGAir0207]QCR38802.1 peptide-binding protein [Nissabacter sp. SGAir0207]
MTTLKDTLKPEVSYLEACLPVALAGRSEEEYLMDYLKSMSQYLKDEPRYYRSMGAYWPALKALLVEQGLMPADSAIDSDVAAIYSYERPALTVVAASLYHRERLESGLLFSSIHQLKVPDEVDDSDYEYVSEDITLESKVKPKH